MPEQVKIAARDHGKSVSDKICGRIAQRGGFPGIVCNTRSAVDRLGDLAVGCVVHAPVNGAHHQLQATALLLSQPGIRRHGQMMEAS